MAEILVYEDDKSLVWGVLRDPYDKAVIEANVCEDCSKWYWHCKECSFFPEFVAAQERERERNNALCAYLLQTLKMSSIEK